MNPLASPWPRAVFAVALYWGTAAHVAAAKSDEPEARPKTVAELTRSLAPVPGFFELYRDQARGRVLLGIAALDQPFLLATSLPYGLGSNDVGLDRGQPGEVRLVEFRRAGNRVLLVQDNTRFQALSSDPSERASAQQAFAESVLWAGEILAEQKEPALLLIDFTPFLISDRHGIGIKLNAAKQGKYTVDATRSAAVLENTRSFPDNSEFEAMLTFTGPGEGEFVRQVAMDPESLTLRQHVSLVRLPPPGFRPRPYHPGSGGFSAGYVDFAQPLSASLDVRFQPRFRLEKTEPDAALSAVKKPIVFYLDRGTPEPVRSALLDGANWWAPAFAKAGFKDAFRVELMPAGVDPMDIRYNVIEWVHRATRGWSYGAPLIDPRTGEIIKGSVTLGSQRVRQDLLIAESLLAPYGKPDEAARKKQAEAMALARMCQLAAHEVGHALGFAHNFAASRAGNGSVMDYPHPILALGANGELDLRGSYGIGVGAWDEFLVQHAYGQFAPERESAALAELRAAAAKAGLRYVGDDDSRAPGSSHPDGLLWDFGPDTLTTFDRLLEVRRKALAQFSPAVLGPERQSGELEARLVPLYLLHRYQTEAVARLLGGASYRYGLAGEGNAGTTAVAPEKQQAALARLVQTLSAEELALPANLLDLLTPPGNDYGRNREYFATRTAPLFDALAAAESAAAVSTSFLFDPARLNRLAWQYGRDANQPGVAQTLAAVFAGTWQRDALAAALPAGMTVQLAVNWVVLDALIGAIDGGQLHPQVEAELRDALLGWQQWLGKNPGPAAVAPSRREAARYIGKYFSDPNSVKRHPAPIIPPGAPI